MSLSSHSVSIRSFTSLYTLTCFPHLISHIATDEYFPLIISNYTWIRVIFTLPTQKSKQLFVFVFNVCFLGFLKILLGKGPETLHDTLRDKGLS